MYTMTRYAKLAKDTIFLQKQEIHGEIDQE